MHLSLVKYLLHAFAKHKRSKNILLQIYITIRFRFLVWLSLSFVAFIQGDSLYLGISVFDWLQLSIFCDASLFRCNWPTQTKTNNSDCVLIYSCIMSVNNPKPNTENFPLKKTLCLVEERNLTPSLNV